MGMGRTRISLGVLALAVTVGLVRWMDTGKDTAPPPAALNAAGGQPFVGSMLGTIPDGDLLALQGNVIPGMPAALAYGELRRLFDYYLSAVGEQSVEAIALQIHSELDRRLPPPQAKKAQRLLGLYLEFKRALVDLERKPELAGNGVQAIRQRLYAMQDLRARYFSAEETQGMFAFEDAYDLDAIARLEVSQNTALDARQKKEQLAVLDAAMPATLREDREASYSVARVEQQVADLRTNGASEDDIYRMRAKAFDPQAASRLAEVDREEASWKNRISIYLEARKRLLQAQANASESELQLALLQLRKAQFTDDEQRRLPAYEQ